MIISDLVKRILLWILFVFFTILAIEDNPQGFIFSIAMLVLIFKDYIKSKISNFSSISFIYIGVVLGLLTEIFAIWSNWNLPSAEKILLHPNPGVDLLLGLFYYSFVIFIWYFLLKRYNFNKKTVFIIMSIMGILTEQMGAIFLAIFVNPLLGVPMALIIACIYGIFPTLAYYLTEDKFSQNRINPKYYHFILALFLIFLQWAIYGNFIHNIILEIFPK